MTESKYQFECLSPTDDVNLGVYEDAINYVFENSDIRNIAISGAYSSGKSSILASYEKKHNNKKFLHISLAHFYLPSKKNKSDKDNTKDENQASESVLEGKILNQLIHQIPSDRIPQTNFRIKKKFSSESIKKHTLEIIALLATIIFFMYFDSWKIYVSTLPENGLKTILELTSHPYVLLINGIITIGLSWLFIYRLIEIQKNKNVFRKLNLKGNEIEIFEESDDSYFDKYLNEVLYLFENVDADVIVFEDMDRFDANRIFERLREINTLVNIKFQKEDRKVLRFFYLLRDDIFVSKDRTKFFDYIIPVVPVIDGSNSYNQLIALFEQSGVFEKFDKNFLQGLSLYIDDMRILKNIYNEFLIYYNRLNIIELDCNKMLAIITYKNLFPRDFADLQLNRGFIYTLFSKKDNFIKNEIEEIEKDIDERHKRITLAREEHLVSMRELNAVFVDKYFKGQLSWLNKNDDELSNYIKGHLTGDNEKEYLFRQQILEDKLNENKLNQEILDLEENAIKIKSMQLHQIITNSNIEAIFSITSTNEIGEVTDFNEIKSSEYFDLLKYLIRNRYIDETYADYMTYFYENSLSRIDKTFLRSVTDRKAKEYTYKLTNPQIVVSRLKLVDFDQEEILNFSLLTHLLHTQTHIEYLERFLDQLKKTNNFKFVGAYFDVTSEMPMYIKYLNIRWPEVFFIALKEHALLERQIREYSIFTLNYCDQDSIESVNKDNCLCDYISNSCDYLAIDNADIDKLIYGFKLLGVCFIGFDYKTLNKNLFYKVYEESLYEINAENLQLIQTEILGMGNCEDIAHKNYTILHSHPESAITQYINENINKYFDVVLEMSRKEIRDDENVAIAVLNNQEITVERKYSYISALQTKITNIQDITDNSLWIPLLDADIVEYSEHNIMECFNVLSLTESVISYINRYDIELDFSKLEDEESIKEKLFDAIIICNDIKNSKYEQILVSLRYYYDNFDLLNISSDKLIILINTNIIKMTENNLNFLRENYPDQKFHFIRRNLEEYVDIMSKDLFLQEELLEILTWDISDEMKIKLLEFSHDAISVIGKNYSTDVCLHILNNNFIDSDLIPLFLSYDQWEASTQERILEYAIKEVKKIIETPGDASEKLKDNLLHTDKLNRDMKIELLVAMMPTLGKECIKEYLGLLDLREYNKIFDFRSRPKFEISEENEKLLTAFKQMGIIKNFEESLDREGYYKIVKSKPQNLW